MLHLLAGLFVVFLAITVSFGDRAITYAIARDTLRVIVYGIVAILALIATIVVVFGL